MAESQTNIGVNAGGGIHAHAISVVQNIIQPADPQPKNVRFKVEKPIQTFTGRETFLKELHKVVKEGQGGGGGGVTVLTQEPLSVVAATGGIGKTETVRRYIQLHGHEYDHIIWIDAEENSFAQRQFLQLATELKISTDFGGKQKEFESILKEIFGKLLLNAHVVLLVFDNAEALEDDEEMNLSGIRSLRPTSLSPFFVEPTIIVTSRNQNWRHQKVIHLDLWTEAEVVFFVTVQLKLDENSENATLALQLGNLFGRLPIALQAAVAVILQQIKRGKKYGIHSLIDEYECGGSRKVLTQKPSDDNKPKKMGDTMLVLWNISLEKILRYEDGKLAIKILCFMAYMSQTRIPQHYLFALFQNSTTEDSFENALEILEDYSLIASVSSDDSDSRSFSIHRMIQDSTIENLRTRTNEEQTLNTIFNDTTFLNEIEVLLKLSAESVNYLETFTRLTFPRSGELVENLIQITNHVSVKLNVDEFRDLTEKTADVVLVTSNISKSIELYERVLEATPSPRSGIDMAKRFELQQALAVAYYEGGHAQKSIDLNLEILEVVTRVLGPDHKYTLETKCSAAIGLLAAGRDDEATKMFQEIAQAFENNGSTQSTEYLEIKFLLAGLLNDKEEKQAALEFVTEKLQEQEEDPDSNSDRIKATKVGIALMLKPKPHLEEVSQMWLETIEDATERFGPFGLTTLEDRRTYALLLCGQKKYDLADPLLLELLETQETQLGPHHRSTLETQVVLAQVYLETKKLDKAEALLNVEVMERVFGPEHLETLGAATVLSYLKESQEKFGDALTLQKKILEVRKNVLAANHEDTLSTMEHIGVLHFKMSEYEKVVQVAQELLERQEKAIGKDHPDAIETLKFITSISECLKSRNDLLGRFVAVTSADAESGKSVLRTSDGNLEDALKGFCDSSSDEENLDIDLQDDALIPSASATDAENQNVATALCIKTEANQIQNLGVQPCGVTESNQPTTSKFLRFVGGKQRQVEFSVTSTAKDLYGLVDKNKQERDPDSNSRHTFATKLHIASKMKHDGHLEETSKMQLHYNEDATQILGPFLVSFFDSNSGENYSDMNLQENSLILSAAATNSENQNVPTASCNETKVNQIQKLEVQVESVTESNQPMKSILFVLAGGTRFRGQFRVSSTVRDLYKFVYERHLHLSDSNYVLTLYPNIQLTKMEQTLDEAKIPKNVALTLKLLKK